MFLDLARMKRSNEIQVRRISPCDDSMFHNLVQSSYEGKKELFPQFFSSLFALSTVSLEMISLLLRMSNMILDGKSEASIVQYRSEKRPK